jgi:hypothetical protein
MRQALPSLLSHELEEITEWINVLEEISDEKFRISTLL